MFKVNNKNTRTTSMTSFCVFIVDFNLISCLFQMLLIAQKMKFSIKDFLSKCDQIRSFLWF